MSALDLRRSRSRDAWARRARAFAVNGHFHRHPHAETRRSVRRAEGRHRDGHDFVRRRVRGQGRRRAGIARAGGRSWRRCSPSPIPSAGWKIWPAPPARAATPRSSPSPAAPARPRPRKCCALPSARWAAPMPRPRPTTIIGACRSASPRMPREPSIGVFEIGMNHFGEIRELVVFRAPACGADHHHRARASGIFRHLRSHRRRQIRNLRRPDARRRGADPRRQSLCRASCAARAEQARVSRILRFGRAGSDAQASVLRRQSARACRLEGRNPRPPVDCLIGAPGAHIASNAVAALGWRWRWLEAMC